ncbi:14276_t:CDS:2 [Funneliformis geosporum]|uniref:17845_t:CDS:1 n=1 Tax=Funneliformis geosporum TaxID=1117311 RepID=A0A9W4WPN2_9GLOM|nr:14276_t:CDS:2 [Funneliformis geosporum]CAI2162588.1 17845_t:CDS:2 [Funneliformis geosporum]
MENQLKAVYHTYPIIMEEEKPENVKKYIQELENRPTAEQLQQAIQQETDKYKDYKKLDTTEQEAINNYSTEIKAELDKPRGIVLSSEEQKKLSTYESLKSELEQVKKDLDKSNSSKSEKEGVKELGNNNSELITRIKNLEQLITSLKQEITESKSSKRQIPLETPSDYNCLREENEQLYEILKTYKLSLSEK